MLWEAWWLRIHHQPLCLKLVEGKDCKCYLFWLKVSYLVSNWYLCANNGIFRLATWVTRGDTLRLRMLCLLGWYWGNKGDILRQKPQSKIQNPFSIKAHQKLANRRRRPRFTSFFVDWLKIFSATVHSSKLSIQKILLRFSNVAIIQDPPQNQEVKKCDPTYWGQILAITQNYLQFCSAWGQNYTQKQI
jgi:hypothetical protein